MEDCNAHAADCVVVSCCCQCLILQILVFILLKLPYKLIRRTRDFARKKLRERKRRGKIMINMVARELVGRHKSKFVENIGVGVAREDDHGKSLEVAAGHNGNFGGCIEEVERVMEELSRKGEFGFGSFWCKEEECEEGYFPSINCLENQEFDDGFVRYQLIKMVNALSCA